LLSVLSLYAQSSGCRSSAPPSFFFQRSAAHRALHSFPTRRSSDLELVCSNSFRSSAPANAVGLLKQEMALLGSMVMRCGEAARVDRKSTRLNSSHDQISYAVFCLKKKK